VRAAATFGRQPAFLPFVARRASHRAVDVSRVAVGRGAVMYSSR
jgi:hypothetical protein